MKNKDKDLEGTDVILNLDEITIWSLDSFNSSRCSGRVSFDIECRTEYGYCEDPEFTGKIKILETKKCRGKGVYLLKVKYEEEEKEEDDGIPFEDKMKELTTELKEQMGEGKKLDEEINKNLKGIGFGV